MFSVTVMRYLMVRRIPHTAPRDAPRGAMGARLLPGGSRRGDVRSADTPRTRGTHPTPRPFGTSREI